MAKVAFLPAADAEYREALDWYSARSPRTSIALEAAVEVALRAIGEAPERWTRHDGRHHFYVLKRFPFSLVDRMEAGDVLIVALAHSSRSATFWQDRT